MPAPFVVRSIHPNNGIWQAHLTLEIGGQPNEILVNATEEGMAMIFGEEVQEGDIRDARFPLRQRAGTNGTKSG